MRRFKGRKMTDSSTISYEDHNDLINVDVDLERVYQIKSKLKRQQ